MGFEAIAYRADGTSDLTIYRGEPLTSVREHAKNKVESGMATRVEIFDDKKQLIAEYSTITHRA